MTERGPQLVPAGEAERRARDALTFPEWGQALTPAQWLERELALRAHPWAAEAMESWLWRGAGGEVLASCETFRMPARLGPRAGEVYAVASVFTEPALRGRGHATAMIDALNAALERRPGALGSVLYSDVGARIYARSGYAEQPAQELVLPAEPGDPLDGVEPLEALLPAPSPPPADPAALTLGPTAAQLDWHLARERFYARALARPPAAFHGARAGRARALWVAWHKEHALRVLWLEPGAAEENGAVLRCAQKVAQRAGLGCVRAWVSHPDLSGLPGRLSPREGELPMVRLYGAAPPFRWVQVQRALWV